MTRFAVAVAVMLLAAGCTSPIKSVQARSVKLDSALRAKIGLPIFPGATNPSSRATHIHVVVASVTTDEFTAIFVSSAPLSQVKSWYDERLPPGSRIDDIHLGDRGVASFQLLSGADSRQVTLIGLGSGTEIQLVETTVTLPTPSRS